MRELTVFVLVFDELSLELLLNEDGEVDESFFPHIAKFSRDSLWFRQAMSNYMATAWSVRSLLTGRLALIPKHPVTPEFVRLQDLSATPEPNFLTTLAEGGYAVSVYSEEFKCFDGSLRCVWYYERGKPGRILATVGSMLVPRGLTFGLWRRVSALRLRVEAQMLAELGRSAFIEPGQASFWHFMISHSPWILSSRGLLTEPGPSEFVPFVNIPEVLARYRSQVRYLDDAFGAFVQGLQASGAWERAVIVVTSDHGTCWTVRCIGRGHVAAVEPSLVRVPMMVRAPFLTPRVSDADYQHIDFFPTISEILNLRWPSEQLNGRSALQSETAERPRHFFLRSLDAVDVGLPVHSVEITNPVP